MRRCTVLVIVLVVMTAFLAVSSLLEESDADDGIPQWNCYGYNITISDSNYNSASYRSIYWRWADSPNGLESEEYMPGPKLELTEIDLKPVDYPPYEVRTIYVQELADIEGTEKTTVFAVNINPLPKSCYVLFMYDDSRGYKYEQVSRNTSVLHGHTPVVSIPSIDPHREGYRFEGWYIDRECTVTFSESTKIFFSYEGEEKKIYPKWTPISSPSPGPSPAPSPSPGTDVHAVTVHPVAGLDIRYDGMIVNGSGTFAFTVKVMDGFRFDLSDLEAQASNGKKLDRTEIGENQYRFTLRNINSDISVFLLGQIQYFKISAGLTDVETVGFDEWVKEGGKVELPLKSRIGGEVKATVYMSYKDITGTSFHEGKVRIDNVTGDILVTAYSEQPLPSEKGGSQFPWWILLAAIAVAALVVAIRRRG